MQTPTFHFQRLQSKFTSFPISIISSTLVEKKMEISSSIARYIFMNPALLLKITILKSYSATFNPYMCFNVHNLNILVKTKDAKSTFHIQTR